ASVAPCEAVMIPTRTVSQGLTAMLGFNPSNDLDKNREDMTAELEHVVSGQITHAIRDTQLDGISIKKDDFLGIIDGKIKVSEKDLLVAAIETLKNMITDESEIITVLYGEEASEAEAENIAEQIEQLYPELEVEIHEGDQPVY